MPRRARIAIVGIPWHIIQRDNNRSACFYAEEDYQRYLCDLKVMMTNHVHSAGSGIRQFMRNLEGSSELQRLVKLIKLDLTSWVAWSLKGEVIDGCECVPIVI